MEIRPRWLGESIATAGWVVALSLLAVTRPIEAQLLLGRVVDVEGEPISDVLVTLAQRVGENFPDDAIQRTMTSASGRFGFDVTVGGDYVLQAERLGLATYTSDPMRLTLGEPVEFRLTLEAEPVLLEPLVVTSAVRPWWELLQPPGLWPFFDRMERYGREGRGRFFTRREVERWRGIPVARSLSSVLPYLRASMGSAGEFFLQGPGGCTPLVFINGSFANTEIRTWSGVVRIPLSQMIDSYSLVAVESYRGMSQAPSELQVLRSGVDLNCPIVSLWTYRR